MNTLACDFGQSKIVFLELQKNGPDIKLMKFQKMSRPKDKDSETLKQCHEVSGFATNKVRISVKGQGVVVRFIQFPKMKPEELRSAITYEAEKYIPFKFNEVVVDFHILDEVPPAVGGAPMINLLLVAVKRDEIYPLIDIFHKADLQVELVDVDALAYMNTFTYFYEEEMKSTVGILDIGAEISTLSVLQQGKPRFIRDISYGGVDIIKRLKRKLNVSDEEAIKILEVDRAPAPEAVAVLKEGLGDLVADLKVSLDYFLDQVQPSEPVSKLFLGGGGGYHPIVEETLTKDLGFPVRTVDIMKKIKLDPAVDEELVRTNQGLLPVVLGLALRDK